MRDPREFRALFFNEPSRQIVVHRTDADFLPPLAGVAVLFTRVVDHEIDIIPGL